MLEPWRPLGHADKHFEGEGEYGLNCRKGRAAFVEFVDSDDTAEIAGISYQPEKPGGLTTTVTEED